jgi:hypothetical protein
MDKTIKKDLEIAMNVKELTKKEFKSTFSEKMNDVTTVAEAEVDIWKYIKLLEKEKYHLSDNILENGIVEKVYRNSLNTYDQILIPMKKKNIYLVIIVNIKEKNIFGHYLLDLNKEYGIEN